MRLAPYATIGFASLLMQTVLVRELLSVFTGNELDIGITLAAWLLAVGLGSMVSSRAGKGFGPSFLVASALMVPSLTAIRYIRPALGLGMGEDASLPAVILSTIVVLGPLCFTFGYQFPAAVRHFDNESRATASRTVYSLEAIGAFVAGAAFTFVLAGRVGHAAIAAAVACLYALVAAYLIRGRAAIAGAAAAVIWAALLSAVMFGIDPVGYAAFITRHSPYGEIRVTESAGQMNVYSSGRFVYAYPDPAGQELPVHLAAAAHADPRYVLLIGGSPAMAGEFLRYRDIKAVDYVELDRVMLNVSLGLLGPADRRRLEAPRVRIIHADGREFIKNADPASYDIVLVSAASPATANLNRFFTAGFISEARKALRPGGILVTRLVTSSGYVGQRTRALNSSIYTTLKHSFRHVELSTEEYGFAYASDDAIGLWPDVLKARYENAISSSPEYFRPYIFDDAFMMPRAAGHKQLLSSGGVLNTDDRPAAYVFSLMRWAEMHGERSLNAVLSMERYAGIIILAAFIIAGAMVFRLPGARLYYSAFSTGFTAMVFTLALLLGFQGRFGFVYESFGMISALFMAGMAGGAWFPALARLAPRRALVALELLCSALAACVPVLIGSKASFYMLAIICGAVIGGLYAAASRSLVDAGRRDGGSMAYGMDMLGSFLGALATALVLVPMLGVVHTLWMVSALKAVSAGVVGASSR